MVALISNCSNLNSAFISSLSPKILTSSDNLTSSPLNSKRVEAHISQLKSLKSALHHLPTVKASPVFDTIMSDSGNTTTNTSATSTGSTNTQASSLASPEKKMATNPTSVGGTEGATKILDNSDDAKPAVSSTAKLATSEKVAKKPDQLLFTKKAIRHPSLRRQTTNPLSALAASSHSQHSSSCPLHGKLTNSSRTSSTSSTSSVTRVSQSQSEQQILSQQSHQQPQTQPSSLSPTNCEMCLSNLPASSKPQSKNNSTSTLKPPSRTSSTEDYQAQGTSSPFSASPQPSSNFLSSKTPILSVEIGTQFSFKSTNHISQNPSPKLHRPRQPIHDDNASKASQPAPLNSEESSGAPRTPVRVVDNTSSTEAHARTDSAAPIVSAVPLSSSSSMGSDLSRTSTGTTTTSPSSSSPKSSSTRTTTPTTNLKTSPKKNKRMTSELVLPTLCVRAPPLKLLGIHRSASPTDRASSSNRVSQNTSNAGVVEPLTAQNFSYAGSKSEQQLSSSMSLPASPTKESLIASNTKSGSLVRANASSSSLVSSTGFVAPPPRQLRSLKTPLYVPSVLRRTFTADQLSTAFAETEPTFKRTISSLTLRAKKSNSMSAAFGIPSQTHWKPDNTRTSCKDCGEGFTLFVRRHHCRKCGDIFCDKDSSYNIRVDQSCQFHLLGQKVKACHDCYLKYVEFVEAADVTKSCLPQGQRDTSGNENYRSITPDWTSDDQSLSSHNTGSSDTLKSNVSSSRLRKETSTSSQMLFKPMNQAANDSNVTLTGLPANLDPLPLRPNGGTYEASAQAFGSVPANWSWSTF